MELKMYKKIDSTKPVHDPANQVIIQPTHGNIKSSQV